MQVSKRIRAALRPEDTVARLGGDEFAVLFEDLALVNDAMRVADSFAELASIAVTMASMVSVVGRNYGSRLAVDLQTLACCLPMVAGSLLAQDFYKALLSLMLIPFGLTTRAMANGVRVYSAADYQNGFFLMLGCVALSIITSAFLYETHCRNITLVAKHGSS